ncbi:MAG: HAD hydrolase family protein [Chloroflexota bacterium]
MPADVSSAPIHLVAVDMDGTLLTSAKTPAPEGARLLAAAARQGVQVVLATTRSVESLRELCRTLGTAAPVMGHNGAQVWATPDGPVWAERALPRAAALAIAELADAHGWELVITVGATTYLRQRPGQALGPLAPGRCEPGPWRAPEPRGPMVGIAAAPARSFRPRLR